MENFTKYIRQNKKAAYAIARANCKHDGNGTCLFSKSDPWMQENCWDEDFSRKTANEKGAASCKILIRS